MRVAAVRDAFKHNKNIHVHSEARTLLCVYFVVVRTNLRHAGSRLRITADNRMSIRAVEQRFLLFCIILGHSSSLCTLSNKINCHNKSRLVPNALASYRYYRNHKEMSLIITSASSFCCW